MSKSKNDSEAFAALGIIGIGLMIIFYTIYSFITS